MSIYTPRSSVNLLIAQARKTGDHSHIGNLQMCTKIEFFDYEISIAMDSSHGIGDLFRSDIRVYKDGKDVSEQFLLEGCSMLYGDAKTLLHVMNRIQQMQEKV